MDVVRLDERDVQWSGVSERVEAGETVEIMRGERVFAKITPGEQPRPEQRSPHPSWRAAGIDWDEIRRFRETLPYDPTNSVVEMRRQARY